VKLAYKNMWNPKTRAFRICNAYGSRINAEKRSKSIWLILKDLLSDKKSSLGL